MSPATINIKYAAAAKKTWSPLARLKSSARCWRVRTPICPDRTMINSSLAESGLLVGSLPSHFTGCSFVFSIVGSYWASALGGKSYKNVICGYR